MILSVLWLSVLMIQLPGWNLYGLLICHNGFSWFVNLNLICETFWIGAGNGLLLSVLEPIRSPWSTIITFENAHLNGLKQFLFIILVVDLLIILMGCMIFQSVFLDVKSMSVSTVHFFVYLEWNLLSVECFPLTYDLPFTFRVKKFLVLGSF